MGWFEQEFEGNVIRAKSGILLAGMCLLTPRLLSGAVTVLSWDFCRKMDSLGCTRAFTNGSGKICLQPLCKG